MRTAYLFLFIFAASFLIGCTQTGKVENKTQSFLPPGHHAQAFEKEITRTVSCKYLLFLPENFGSVNKQWPLIRPARFVLRRNRPVADPDKGHPLIPD